MLLCLYINSLHKENFLKRTSFLYEELDYESKTDGRYAISIKVLQKARIFAFALTILYLGDNLVAQVLTMSYSTMLIMSVIGYIHPMKELQRNFGHLRGDFILLMFIDMLLFSSDPMLQGDARLLIGWAMIAMLSLLIISYQIRSIHGVVRHVKLFCKRKFSKKLIKKVPVKSVQDL